MNYTIILIAIILGVVVGRRIGRSCSVKALVGQKKKKAENKNKIMEFIKSPSNTSGRVVNDDVEKLLGVSDSTATRYLDELEKEEKIKQHGKVGQGVYYTLK